MRTEDLEYLITVADTSSLNKASTKLNVPYQTINNGIKNLENEFSIILFERTSQGTFLTKDGKAFYSFAKKILSDTQNMKNTFNNSYDSCSNQLSGSLNVGVSPVINHSFFPTFISNLQKTYPKLRLYIYEYDNNDLLSLLNDKAFDVILFFSNHFQDDYEQYSDNNCLCKAFMMACVSKQHPLAKHHTISIKTMLKYPISIYKRTNLENDLEQFLGNSAKLKSFFMTDNYDLYINSISDNKSIVILPRFFTTRNFFVSKLSSDSVTIPIKNIPPSYFTYKISSSLSSSKQKLSTAFIEEFISFLKKY